MTVSWDNPQRACPGIYLNSSQPAKLKSFLPTTPTSLVVTVHHGTFAHFLPLGEPRFPNVLAILLTQECHSRFNQYNLSPPKVIAITPARYHIYKGP